MSKNTWAHKNHQSVIANRADHMMSVGQAKAYAGTRRAKRAAKRSNNRKSRQFAHRLERQEVEA